MCYCCCEEGECCESGFFAHAFILCLTTGFALSRDVFECTVPGLSYTSAPGVVHKQLLCCYVTKSWTPAPTVPVHFWCLCNLCLCGFDVGNYRDTSANKPDSEPPTIVSAPAPQHVSRQGSEEMAYSVNHTSTPAASHHGSSNSRGPVISAQYSSVSAAGLEKMWSNPQLG